MPVLLASDNGGTILSCQGTHGASHPASSTDQPQAATSLDLASEQIQSTSDSEGENHAHIHKEVAYDLVPSDPPTVMPIEQLNCKVAKPSNATETFLETKEVAKVADAKPWIYDYFKSWETDNGRFMFVAHWPVPHSTDVLRTYWWSTLEAIKVCADQQYAASYSDHQWIYYYVELERLERLLPDKSLAEAVRQSSLFRQELEEWKLDGSKGMFRTSSCIVGLKRGSVMSELCLLQVTVCRSA